ncbi:MAG: TonB-dependent receptor [Polyangia bacterium]
MSQTKSSPQSLAVSPCWPKRNPGAAAIGRGLRARGRWFLLAALPWAGVPAAAADEPAYETMSLEELLQVPLVTTASRQDEALTDTPATTVVITREEIRQRGYSFLKDVLRDLPGMETQEYFHSQIGTRVPVRGQIGNHKIIVLVNGMRVNPPGGENMMFRSDFSVRDADQIEIVYGPGSTLYGQDAISAVVNVITRQTPADNTKVNRENARDRFLKPQDMSRRIAMLGMEFGYPVQKEAWGALNLRFGDARIYASVHYLDKQLTDLSSAYPDLWNAYATAVGPRGGELDPARFDTGLNVMARLEYGSTSIQVWHRQSARRYSEGTGPSSFAGSIPESYFEDMSTVAEARNKMTLGKYFTLESILSFNRYEVQPSTRLIIIGSPMLGQPPSWDYNNWQYARGVSGSLEERLTFRLAKRLALTAGFFAAHYDITPLGTVPGGANLQGSVPAEAGTIDYYTAKGDPSSLVRIPNLSSLTYQDFAGYLEGNWLIFKPLRLIVGLRLDKYTSVEEFSFSPRAALVFNYNALSMKYVFARAFVAPTPYFKDRVGIAGGGGKIHAPEANLRPEKAISNEFNISYNHRHFNISTSFYYNTASDLFDEGNLVPNLVGPVWLDPQGARLVTLYRTINHGDSRALGWDIWAKYNFWKFSGWASYSFTDTTTTADGVTTPVTGLSVHNFRFGVTWAVLKNLTATAGLLVKSYPSGLVESAAVAGQVGTPWEINAHIVYSPIPSIDLYADFRNLTDHKYYLLSSNTSSPTNSTTNGPYAIQAFQGTGGLRLVF